LESSLFSDFKQVDDIILTLRVPLSIGFYGGKRLSFMVNVDKLFDYMGLEGIDAIKYALAINANYQNYDVKYIKLKINMFELALKYKEMLVSGECSNYAGIARKLNVSRAWVTKVMKHMNLTND
jgi:hypothetical protein